MLDVPKTDPLCVEKGCNLSRHTYTPVQLSEGSDPVSLHQNIEQSGKSKLIAKKIGALPRVPYQPPHSRDQRKLSLPH